LANQEKALALTLDYTRRATEHFRGQGVDLRGYTTPESADDLDAVRAALGYERINLLGFSYGTHLAIATIRRHEDHIANVVLAGIEGPNQTHKLPLNMDIQFRKLARMVADDPAVGRRVPDLTALYERVLERLDREPMAVQIRAPDGSVHSVTVGPWGLPFILRFDIGDASDLPVFPRLLWSIDQGDPSVLAWFVQKRYGIFTGVNLMSMLTDGASGATASRWAVIREQAEHSAFGDVMILPWPYVDTATGVEDLGDEYRAPLVSDVRALLLSGSLDWNTPPFQAEELRWGMRNAVHLSVDNAGHEQVLPQPGIQRAILRFLAGEDVGDVRVSLPPLRFVPLEGTGEVTHPSVEGG
jgi:pimeloyl-ACP methyl ester carboxylesterase